MSIIKKKSIEKQIVSCSNLLNDGETEEHWLLLAGNWICKWMEKQQQYNMF